MYLATHKGSTEVRCQWAQPARVLQKKDMQMTPLVDMILELAPRDKLLARQDFNPVHAVDQRVLAFGIRGDPLYSETHAFGPKR